MATHRKEKRHITITYDYDVNVRASGEPNRTGPGGGRMDEEQFERWADRWLRKRLTRDGRQN